MHRRYKAICSPLIWLLCGLLLCRGAAAEDKISFGLDWQFGGRHAGFILADQLGYYRQEGISAQVQRGSGSAEVARRVASGAITFGFGDIGSVVIARASGLPVKAIAVIYGKGAYGLWIRSDTGIRSPKDLEGKVIAATAGSAMRLMFPAFAALTRVDESKVTWLTADGASHLPMLLAGRVDATADMMTGWPEAAKASQRAKVPLLPMWYADYGLDVYGNGLLTRDDTIAQRPDLVRRFVRATLRGLTFAFDDPNRAAALLNQSHPEIDPVLASEEIRMVRDLAWTEEAKAHGLGYLAPARVEKTRDVVARAYNLSQEVPLADIYTNDFLVEARTKGN